MAKHGLTDTTEFTIWQCMKQRCFDTNYQAYKDYGGRGITVCDRWLGEDGFTNFLADMGNRPQGRSLDRKNNDLGYSPDNCTWSTAKEQANNRRNSRRLNINGVTKTLAQWVDESQVKRSTVKQRFYVYGWTIEQALGIEDRRIVS